jgi:spore coat protein H
MLEDVNNYELDINQVFDKHFNRENYLTWMAVNILFGNIDTNSQNFYLYSPINSDTWYFLPWDYDFTWDGYLNSNLQKEYAPWQLGGLSNYMESVLHRRFFKDPNNLKALSAKIEELTKIINKQNTLTLLNKYFGVANKFVRLPPDVNHLPLPVGEFETRYKSIPDAIERNRKNYYEGLEKPMPVYMWNSVNGTDYCTFTWDQSFDFHGYDITYDFQIASDPNFSNIIAQKKGLSETCCSIGKLVKGVYYWRIIINNSKGNSQGAFDIYISPERVRYFGVKEFVVK